MNMLYEFPLGKGRKYFANMPGWLNMIAGGWSSTGIYNYQSGEPYSIAQVELRRRFPAFALLFSPLSGALQVAYLLPADRYGKGLYQEEPSIMAPGCLEQLIDAIAARIEALAA